MSRRPDQVRNDKKVKALRIQYNSVKKQTCFLFRGVMIGVRLLKRETRKTWRGRKSEGRKGNGGRSHFFLKASAKGLLVNRSGLLSFLSFAGSAFASVFVPSFFP